MVDPSRELLERHAGAHALLASAGDSTLFSRLPPELVDRIFHLAMPSPLCPFLGHRDPAVASFPSASAPPPHALFIPRRFAYEFLSDCGGQCFITAMDDAVITDAVDQLLQSAPPEAAFERQLQHWTVQKVTNEFSLARHWRALTTRHIARLRPEHQHPSYLRSLYPYNGPDADIVYGSPVVLARAACKMPCVLTAQRLAALENLLKLLSPGCRIVASLVRKAEEIMQNQGKKDEEDSKDKDKRDPAQPKPKPKPKRETLSSTARQLPSAATHRIKFSLSDGTDITDEDAASALSVVLDTVGLPTHDDDEMGHTPCSLFGLSPRRVPPTVLSNGGQYVFVECDIDGDGDVDYEKPPPAPTTISISSVYGTPYTPQRVPGTNSVMLATAAFPTTRISAPSPYRRSAQALLALAVSDPYRPLNETLGLGPKWPPTFNGIYTPKLGGEGFPPLSFANAFAAWIARSMRDLGGCMPEQDPCTSDEDA